MASLSPVRGEKNAELIAFVCPKNVVNGLVRFAESFFPLMSNNAQVPYLAAHTNKSEFVG